MSPLVRFISHVEAIPLEAYLELDDPSRIVQLLEKFPHLLPLTEAFAQLLQSFGLVHFLPLAIEVVMSYIGWFTITGP